MRNLINLKWLMATILLCTPMFTWAQDEGDAEGTTTKSYELHIDDYPWNYTAAASGSITINYDSDNAWGEFKLTDGSAVDLSVYKGCKIVYTDASDVQIMIKYADSENGDKYQDLSGSGTFEYTFETDYGNVTTFELQGKAVNAAVSVSEAYLIKQDDTQEAMVYGGPSWGCTYIAHSLPAITFTGQYGSVYLLDSETEEPATFTYGQGNSMAFTITFSEATTGALVVEPDGTDGNNLNYWYNINTGSTTATFTIDDSAVSADVAKIYIKSNNDNDADYSEESGGYTSYATPYTIHFTSITAEVTTASNGDEEENGGDENGGNTNETNPYISVTDEGKAYLNFTTDYVKWNADGGDNIEISTGNVPNTATITIGGDSWSGGVGCSYSTLDISDYYQMVVHYSVTAASEENQESINAKLILYSGWDDGENASLYDSENTGTMRFTINNAVNDFDPSSIIQIVFMANHACTINVTSIQFLTEEEAATEDEKMLYSTFYLWDTVSDGCTKSNESYNADTGSGDYAPFKINSAHSYDGGCWWFGDVDEDQYWGIEIKVQTTQSVKVRIAIQYAINGDNNSLYTEKYTAYCTADEETTLILPFLSSYDHYVDEVFIQLLDLGDNSETCDITITSAKLVGSTNTTYQGDYVTILTSDTDGYATYYNGTNDYRMPLGLEGSTVTGTGSVISEEDDENLEFELTTPWEYKNEENNVNGGDIVPAGTPLVLKGVGDDPDVTYTAFLDTTGNGEAPETNLLHGKDEPATAEEMVSITSKDNDDNGDVDYYYFKLSYNSAGEVGFFAGADNCAAFTMENTHKAWLAIAQSVIDNINSESEDGKFVGFHLSDTDNSENGGGGESTTGITAVTTTATNGAIYNLQGVRVNDMNQKGIYIVDGKKVVKQ